MDNKANGNMNQMVGSTKQTVGNAVGLDSMAENGQKQHAEGTAQKVVGQATELAQGVYDQVVGKTKDLAGGMTGDQSQEASGKMQEKKGEMQKNMNS
ncbi:hypothetical protein MVEN_02218100 [Mycena venus]|uniref:CsbD-like domain-containing protein n=1 Tax=Mycena venus TaxID=2733690 RepID=A0A8H6X7N2_9AGAR|nr:hypothetical protein MVEN_02218100 [Mycena venus]